MHSKSDDMEIMINDEVIKELSDLPKKTISE